MSSSDINMSELKLMLENHFERTENQLSDIRRENAEFRLQVNKDFQAFTERTESRLETFTERIDNKLDKVDARLDYIQTEIHQVNNKLTGLEHDVSSLYHWDYWLLSLIIASMVMPQLGGVMKALITAISEGIAGIVSLFRSGKSKE